MSCLLLTTNRTYLKFPIYIFYRHLSTIEYRNYDQFLLTTSHGNLRSNSLQTSKLKPWKFCAYQKRSITLHVPPVEDKQAVPNRNGRIPFQFPPGNPNDKPKIEHLRFIENQLINIVNNWMFSFSLIGIFVSLFLVTGFL